MSVTWKLINKNEYLYFESSERGEKFSICLGRANERKTWAKAQEVAREYHEEKMREHQHKIRTFNEIMDLISTGKDHIHTFKIAEDHEHGVPHDQRLQRSHIHSLKSTSLKDRLKEIVGQIDKKYEPRQRQEVDYERLKEIMNKLSKQRR